MTGRACRAAQSALPLRYYGALTAGDEATLALHLSSCAGCAEDWEALRRMLDAAGPSTLFPRESEVDWEGFARAAVERARAAEASRAAANPRATVKRPRFLPNSISAPGFWAGLAAAALVVAILWTLSPTHRRRAGDGGPTSPPVGPAAESARESARMIEDSLARPTRPAASSTSRSRLRDRV